MVKTEYTENDKNDLIHTVNVKDDYHAFDAGLAFGLGYHLMKGKAMNVSLQYYLGLSNITKDIVSEPKYNRVFYFSIGIPIGKQKNVATPTHSKATAN